MSSDAPSAGRASPPQRSTTIGPRTVLRSNSKWNFNQASNNNFSNKARTCLQREHHRTQGEIQFFLIRAAGSQSLPRSPQCHRLWGSQRSYDFGPTVQSMKTATHVQISRHSRQCRRGCVSEASVVAWDAELQTVFLVRRTNVNVIDDGVPMPDEWCLGRITDSVKTPLVIQIRILKVVSVLGSCT